MALKALRDEDPARIGGYRLTARLGAGGMGVVYLGTARDGTRAAVKVLRPELADDLEFRARFRREVAALTRVDGICAVRVIEADTESDRPFMATEYAPGPTLAEDVAARGPLGAGMLTGLAVGLAEALAAIHAAGVIHRDFKPGNVILTPSGPKVIDFGIAQVLDATSVTRTGLSVGSPGFMAPEQIRGQAGQPADIFAWGLTLAYAASGQPPFGTGPADVIFYRILHDSPDIAAVPGTLRPLVTAAVARDPAQRPAAAGLLRRLASGSWEPGADAGDATRVVLARTWPGPAAPLPQTFARRPARRGRERVVLPLAAAVAVLGIGLGVALAGSGNPTTAVLTRPPVPSLTATPQTAATPSDPPLYTSPGPSGTAWQPIANIEGTLSPVYPPPGTAGATWQDAAAFSDAAITYIGQFGYAPYQAEPSWDSSPGALNAIVAHPVTVATGGVRVFFFIDGYVVGTDTPDGSSLLTTSRVNGSEVLVHYVLGQGGTADVRFQANGYSLVALDPVPSSALRN